MSHLRREKFSRGLVTLGLVPILCVVPPAAAEIFKCVAKNGMPRYQNFPCEFDSIGWAPLTPRVPNSPPPPIGRPVVSVASAGTWTNATEAQVGMTPDELKALWGEPMEIVHEETTVGRVEIWRYDDNSTVQFDSRNRIVAVTR